MVGTGLHLHLNRIAIPDGKRGPGVVVAIPVDRVGPDDRDASDCPVRGECGVIIRGGDVPADDDLIVGGGCRGEGERAALVDQAGVPARGT